MLGHLQKISVLCILSISGCVNMTANINPVYKPLPGNTSPLQTIRPLNVVLQVEDQRPSYEQKRIGDRRGGFGKIIAGVNSTRSAPVILEEALASEFTNNGHLILATQSTAADRIVRVSVKKCWTENRVDLFNVTVMGSIVSDVTIIDPTTATALVSRVISGNSTDSHQLALESSYEEALNKALVDFVRSFSRDPQILNALRPSP